jgi:hypothetical protein
LSLTGPATTVGSAEATAGVRSVAAAARAARGMERVTMVEILGSVG